MRLRYKMMAALLATGLGSVALVGGVAYVSVNYKVDSLRRQQAAEHFHKYMTAYLAEYGDWPTATATESFDRFVRRLEAAQPRTEGEVPSEMLARMPPNINDRARYRLPAPGPAGRIQDGRPADLAPPPAAGAAAPPPDLTLPAVRRRSANPASTPSAPPDSTAGQPPAIQRPAREGVAPPPQAPRPARDGYGPPPDDQRPPARDGYGAPPEGQRPIARDSYGPPPDGQRPPARDGYGPPPEGQRPPARDGYGPPPDGQRPPARDGYGPPPEDQRPAARDGYGPPPEGQRPSARDGYGAPPEGQRPPARDGYGPPPEAQRPPARDGYGPPPEGQRPPARDGYGPPPEGQRPPARDGYGAPPEGQRPAPMAAGKDLPRSVESAGPARAAQAPATAPTPGQPDAARAGQPGFGPALPREPGDHPGERQPPPRRGDGPPPFHFVLTDADYNVLLGGGRFRPGDVLSEKLRTSARPIVVNGKAVAYMSSEGSLTPTPQEQRYLEALYNSLLWGIAAAAGLATLLGVLLSRGLSRSLSNLTKAVRAMHEGKLRQQVPVQGKDEVGALANAFNEMSEQLAQSHDELNASHQTILNQAEQLRELSIRDALTQLYNRRHFDEQANTLFNQAVRYKRPLTLVICDIDHFKKINDKYSHATGDAVLRHVGNILRKHMRLSDLVARYGGEEFVMAFPETPGPQAAALCDKLRGQIEAYPWHEVHPDLKVTMSMGVFADIAVGSAETMLQKADALLYRAKETGRNRVCFA